MSQLNIRVMSKEIATNFSISIVFFDGVVDKQQIPYIDAQVTSLINKRTPIVFNMAGVTYINLNALEFFVDIGESAEKYGFHHIMSNLHPQIYTLFCNMGINFLFSIYGNEDDALKKAREQQLSETKRRDKMESIPGTTSVLNKMGIGIQEVCDWEVPELKEKDLYFIKKIKEMISQKALELPVIPSTALRLMDLSANPGSSPEELEKEIGKDPTLASTLLKVANSCVYCGVMPVESIKAGIVRLGRKRLRSMIMALTLGSKIIKGKKIDIIARNLWMHSLASAYMTSAIAKSLKMDDSVVFSAALLHDIHKAILLPICRDALKDIVDYFPETPVLEMVYQEHAETIFQEMKEKWNFPVSFINILLHKKDFLSLKDEEEKQNAALVFLGNQFIKAVEKKARPGKLEEAFQYLHIKKEQLPLLIQESERIYKETASTRGA
ncbi:MAG: HDOD domain-containing protein [Candidatus Brocadiae bacterium]|nr:HDOD domain-containing protein [Candidatus Brocadiia bacterium]